MRKKNLKINGFYKWLSSTKFQVSFIAMWMIFVMIPLFELDSKYAAKKIVEIVICYCGTRVLEPVVEFVVKITKAINSGYSIVRKK